MDRVFDDMPPFRDFIKARFRQMDKEFDGTAKELAKKLGMTEVSLSRYKKYGCAIKSPKARALIKIVAKNRPEYVGLMTHYYPEEARLWREVYNEVGYSNEKSGLAANSLVTLDEIHYYLFAFAGLEKGLPVEFIEKCWAQLGFEALEDYMEKSLLTSDADVVHRENKAHTYGDLEVVKRLIQFIAKDFPISNILLGKGAIANAIGNLNADGLKAIKEEGISSSIKLVKILGEPKYQGDIPVSVSLLAGPMKNADLYVETVQKTSELRKKENDSEK